MPRNAPLLLLLLAYLAVGGLYAARTPAWQAPDEPAHYNYVRQLAEGKLPTIEASDYDEAYRRQIVSSKFAPQYAIAPLTYEDWQPPLYYFLQTPVYLLSDGQLLFLRLSSVLLGTGIVVAAYGVARTIWPRRRWWALVTASFVAFLPQHVAMLASVNNDTLAELLVGAMLWLLLSTLLAPMAAERRQRRWWLLGLLLGLGFLTKATVYMMAVVLGLALVVFYRDRRAQLRRAATRVVLPAFVLGAPWWLRNLVVYSGLDPLGIQAHDAVVVGQTRTIEWIDSYGLAETLQRMLQTTFRSFWGQFGWMGVVMDSRIYLLLLLFSILVVAGIGLAFARIRWRPLAGLRFEQRLALVILATTFLLSLLVYVGYNLTYVQHQGRYLFPALIPISLAVAVGIGGWARPLVRRWRWMGYVMAAGFGLALVGLDLLALYRFIVPQLAGP